MKTKIVTVFVLAVSVSCLSSGARAQSAATTPNSSTPPPDVAAAPAPAPAPNQIIYLPRLPSAVELTNAASAQGLTIEKIEQVASQVTVSYKSSAGATSIVAYQLLPAASAPATATIVTPSPAPVIVQPAPRVVYYEPAYSYYPAYGPSYWYPPVSLSLGFGYGFRGGIYHGGFYRGGYFRGGFRR